MPPQVQPVLGHLQQRIQALRFESLRKNCLQFEFRRFGLPKANTRQIVARFNRAIESRRMAVRLSEAKQGNKRQQQPLSNPPPPAQFGRRCGQLQCWQAHAIFEIFDDRQRWNGHQSELCQLFLPEAPTTRHVFFARSNRGREPRRQRPFLILLKTSQDRRERLQSWRTHPDTP